jgi:hypothetical protein
MKFAEGILEAANGQPIEAIVIGPYGGWRDDEHGVPNLLLGAILTWDEAKPMLDYEWDTSFGGAQCHPIYAWTASRVLWVHEYDGSTGMAWAPRNPESGVPALSGGEDYG